MKTVRPRFSLFVHFYVCVFFLILGLLPSCAIVTAGRRTDLPSPYLAAAVVWLAAVVGGALYARHRCSSDDLRYRDGLLWVAASMMTGWVYMSFFIVIPVLFAVFTGSVAIALYGDARHTQEYAPARFSRIVHYFYRNRMIQ